MRWTPVRKSQGRPQVGTCRGRDASPCDPTKRYTNSASSVRVWKSGGMDVWTYFASIRPHADGGRHRLSALPYPNPASGFGIMRAGRDVSLVRHVRVSEMQAPDAGTHESPPRSLRLPNLRRILRDDLHPRAPVSFRGNPARAHDAQRARENCGGGMGAVRSDARRSGVGCLCRHAQPSSWDRLHRSARRRRRVPTWL